MGDRLDGQFDGRIEIRGWGGKKGEKKHSWAYILFSDVVQEKKSFFYPKSFNINCSNIDSELFIMLPLM